MAYNLDDIRSRIASLTNKTKKTDIWKAKDEHDVRLLPYPFAKDPFVELHFHYDIDGQTVLCPKLNFQKDCAICEFGDLLRSWKDQNGNDKPDSTRKQDWEIFKKIQPKVRIFIPLAVRGEEGDGAKFWGISPTGAQEVLAICAEADRIEAVGAENTPLDVLFNPKLAYDLHISFAKPGEKGNNKQFGIATAKGKLKPTKLLADAKAQEELLKSVKKITEVYPEQSSEEVARIFKKFTNGAQAEAKPEGGTEKYPAKTETPKVTGGRSIDEAFSDMLGDEA